MDGGHHNVTRCLPLQLDDALAEIGFYDFDAVLLQVGIHPALLGEHRLRLDEFLYVMVLQYAIYNLVEFMSVLSPMYDTAVFFGLGGKLVKIFVEMGNRMALDGTRFLA